MKKYIFFFFLLVGFNQVMNAQVKIGGDINVPSHSSAVLELESTTRGFLLPRLASVSAISNPAVGLLVYNTTLNVLQVYTGSGGWLTVAFQGQTSAPAAPTTAIQTVDEDMDVDQKADEAMVVPVGTKDERPAEPKTGMIRFNTTSRHFEGFNGTEWVNLDL